jgi:capsular polysaccharide biosynthesis protein
VKDPDPMVTLSADATAELRERLWAYEDFSAAEEHPSIDVTGTFASLGFLRAALRRRRRLWLGLGVLGLIIGCGVYAKFPPAYSASTTLLLTNAPGTDPTTTILTNQSEAQSQPVAAAVVKQLGLTQSPGSLLAAYTAVSTSSEVLQITVKAPSIAMAVKEAQAIASQFLSFRTSVLRTQEQQQEAALNQQVTQAEQNLDALGKQITTLGGTIPSATTGSTTSSPSTGAGTTSPSSSAGSKVAPLEAKYTDASAALFTLKQQVAGTIAQNQVNVVNQINGSQVLDPAAPAKHSKLKYIGYDVVTGLFAGLVLGMAFVLVQALISDRLRRRDDIAAALGVPVRLSVGPIKQSRLSLSPRARAARERDLRRISLHLQKAVPERGREASALAIVPVDNALTVAPAVLALAQSCARDGTRVIVADLTPGAPAARLLGASGTGVETITQQNWVVVTVIPDPDDLAPMGPLRRGGAASAGDPASAAPPDEALRGVFQSADLLLTIAPLDPGTGGDHLATWATDAVAIITAGRTPGARAYAVGEMLRLSGVRVHSAVIVDADETDDSLGLDIAIPELAAGNA